MRKNTIDINKELFELIYTEEKKSIPIIILRNNDIELDKIVIARLKNRKILLSLKNGKKVIIDLDLSKISTETKFNLTNLDEINKGEEGLSIYIEI